MKIYFSRSGGFAAIELRSAIDTAQLADEERRRVEELVEAAQFFDQPERIQDGGGGADRFQFTLTIQHEGQSHTVEVGEAAMPAELQALVQEVTLMARRSRGQ